ncbi:hypothetical protein O0L34_g12878 [Tuta absoluta]|nr:hypothetical protein O0L34_g12878 [Tuta absoluta]
MLLGDDISERLHRPCADDDDDDDDDEYIPGGVVHVQLSAELPGQGGARHVHAQLRRAHGVLMMMMMMMMSTYQAAWSTCSCPPSCLGREARGTCTPSCGALTVC